LNNARARRPSRAARVDPSASGEITPPERKLRC
jgi:hypothetical protein